MVNDFRPICSGGRPSELFNSDNNPVTYEHFRISRFFFTDLVSEAFGAESLISV